MIRTLGVVLLLVAVTLAQRGLDNGGTRTQTSFSRSSSFDSADLEPRGRRRGSQATGGDFPEFSDSNFNTGFNDNGFNEDPFNDDEFFQGGEFPSDVEPTVNRKAKKGKKANGGEGTRRRSKQNTTSAPKKTAKQRRQEKKAEKEAQKLLESIQSQTGGSLLNNFGMDPQIRSLTKTKPGSTSNIATSVQTVERCNAKGKCKKVTTTNESKK